jgi:hypothetical protein
MVTISLAHWVGLPTMIMFNVLFPWIVVMATSSLHVYHVHARDKHYSFPGSYPRNEGEKVL